jgi:hypothetical protein
VADKKLVYWVVLTTFWPHEAPYPLYDWYVTSCEEGSEPEPSDQGDYYEQLGQGPFPSEQIAIDTMIAWLDDDDEPESWL